MNLTQIISAYSKKINETPFLMSILYDLDLLPEQIETMIGARAMAGVVEAYEQGFRDGIEFITRDTKL